MNNLIIENWEREAIKDRIYIQEEKQLLIQELQEELRRPATIYVVDHNKVLSNEHKFNALPF